MSGRSCDHSTGLGLTRTCCQGSSLQPKINVDMIAQLRATRVGCAVLRSITGRQPTPPACFSQPSRIQAVSLTQNSIRFATDYRSSGSSNSFVARQRDRANGNDRNSFASRPSSECSPSRSDSARADRPQYRSRFAQGGAVESARSEESSGYRRKEYGTTGNTSHGDRRDARGNSSGFEAMANRRIGRAFDSERREGPRQSAWSRSDNASKGYLKRERPSYDKSTRNSKESSEGGMFSRTPTCYYRTDRYPS